MSFSTDSNCRAASVGAMIKAVSFRIPRNRTASDTSFSSLFFRLRQGHRGRSKHGDGIGIAHTS
jgi:hypothetical protein